MNVEIRVQCLDPFSFELLESAFAAFLVDGTPSPRLSYRIGPVADNGYVITRDGCHVGVASDAYELLYTFEKDLTLELQHQRADLLFLHAAALERNGRATLLVAPSGAGKSTTAWALVRSGFNYLSDELAPIDLGAQHVWPYPHALCLKSSPPEPFALPAATIRTKYTLHVPTTCFQSSVVTDIAPLSAILFVRFESQTVKPSMRRVSSAQAAAHIYANALNLLAHEHYGLDAAVQVARSCDCYELVSGDLKKTCELVTAALS